MKWTAAKSFWTWRWRSSDRCHLNADGMRAPGFTFGSRIPDRVWSGPFAGAVSPVFRCLPVLPDLPVVPVRGRAEAAKSPLGA